MAPKKRAKGRKGKKPIPETLQEIKKDKNSQDITASAVLTSMPGALDIQIESFQLSFKGTVLIQDGTLELNMGQRYGLIGRNGSGKSTLLKAIALREVPIPDHIDLYHLSEEAEPSDEKPLEAVVSFAQKRVKALEDEEEKVIEEYGPDCELLMDIYDRLDKLDPTTFEKRAGELLHGLGFSKEMLGKATKDMSGGWRMRVALAQALFVRPSLLLLDEPTNHLDLEACVWLEDYLSKYDRILLVISHSQDFLNGVCTNIIHLNPKKQFNYYGGNYDAFVKTKKENEVNQMKKYYKQQDEIKHIKEFIASCGTYSNLVKQAKSRQKILDKMYADGLVEKVEEERKCSFKFPACGELSPPVLAFQQVSFSYSGKSEDFLYTNLDFGLDLDSRVSLVGPNGAGKSTLLKLMCREIEPTVGNVQRHNHLKVARYHQHSEELLDGSLTPIEFMQKTFREKNYEIQEWRQQLGRFGISGKLQVVKIDTLSDGQRTRIVFCWIAQQNPHMLLFDEPTNHLDMEAIDALAEAINTYEGGMVLVSHDFRLLEQCAKEIWVCDNKSVTRWEGNIQSYKNHLKSGMGI